MGKKQQSHTKEKPEVELEEEESTESEVVVEEQASDEPEAGDEDESAEGEEGAGEAASEDEESESESETEASGEESEEDDAADGDDEEKPLEDEVVVSIGDTKAPVEEEEARAPAWVREVRRQNRELARRNRELEEKLKSTSPENKVPAVGPKPKLEDHDFDDVKFEKALETWLERKRAADAAQQTAEATEREQQAAWQKKLEDYGQAKAALKVRDFEDAEIAAQGALSATQQGIIVQGSENPALIIYALGKNPKHAKEIGAIKDPVKFAFAVAKLEKDLKVTARKPKNNTPPPERSVRGSAPSSGAVDSNLARLRADAEKSGDYSKVIAYKAQRRAKANT